MNSFIRRSWVEIDLSQIKKNYELYKKIYHKPLLSWLLSRQTHMGMVI